MTEKKERIYIRQYGENNPCDICEDTSGEECDFCVKDYEWNQSITRQEAIEKMAKAITFEMYKAFPNPNKEVNKRYNSYINYAKAALNALLSEGR